MNDKFPLYELVVLSGKGGTGKTSVTASLAVLSGGRAVFADCDVDAANLELVLGPTLRERASFSGGERAVVDPGRCTGCGRCVELCRFGAIEFAAGPDGRRVARIDPPACEGCGVCERLCAERAISMQPVDGGAWFVSDTRHGPLVHARLTPGLGNSGKLATQVRERARREARALGRPLVLVDGPPGVGCPVIATLTGASQVLAVTEPTPSGEHDLRRLLELCRHFRIPVWVCLNKGDLFPELAVRIEALAAEFDARCVGSIPFDPAVTAAQRAALATVEHGDGPAARALVELWGRLSPLLPGGRPPG
ncbi:MAG TPA: 4Fe-4S binding protein [Opitutaceae bacterium]|nr:4Fe-4S binding protein [Opitutaceae bacterium]